MHLFYRHKSFAHCAEPQVVLGENEWSTGVRVVQPTAQLVETSMPAAVLQMTTTAGHRVAADGRGQAMIRTETCAIQTVPAAATVQAEVIEQALDASITAHRWPHLTPRGNIHTRKAISSDGSSEYSVCRVDVHTVDDDTLLNAAAVGASGLVSTVAVQRLAGAARVGSGAGAAAPMARTAMPATETTIAGVVSIGGIATAALFAP